MITMPAKLMRVSHCITLRNTPYHWLHYITIIVWSLNSQLFGRFYTFKRSSYEQGKLFYLSNERSGWRITQDTLIWTRKLASGRTAVTNYSHQIILIRVKLNLSEQFNGVMSIWRRNSEDHWHHCSSHLTLQTTDWGPRPVNGCRVHYPVRPALRETGGIFWNESEPLLTEK